MKQCNIRAILVSMVLLVSMVFGAMPTLVQAGGDGAFSFRANLLQNKAVDPTKYLKDTFFIKNKNSGLYLSVNGGKAENGTNVVQQIFNGDTNQKWKLKKQSNGTYQLVSGLPGEYSLNVAGGSNKNGANVQIWQSKQGVRLVKTSGSYHKMETSASGKAKKVVGVRSSSESEGANIQQWDFGKKDNDQWLFIRAENPNTETKTRKKAVAQAKDQFELVGSDGWMSPDFLFLTLAGDHLLESNQLFSDQDALYAVNHCGADWNQYAVRAAKEYSEYAYEESSVSRLGLIERLSGVGQAGFTKTQAIYGVDHSGLDWDKQMVTQLVHTAEAYPMSRDKTKAALQKAKFTQTEVNHFLSSFDQNWNSVAVAYAKQEFVLEAYDDDSNLYACSPQETIQNLVSGYHFTKSLATYGVDHAGINWNKQATERAKYYLEQKDHSRQQLIDKLVKNGFSKEQATYGADAAKK